MKWIIVCWIVSATLFQDVALKFVTNSEPLSHLSGNSWMYMTKFITSPGVGSFQMRCQLQEPLNTNDHTEVLSMTILVYLDAVIDKVMTLNSCEEREQYAKYKLPISVPIDGSWSQLSSENLNDNYGIHIWFFTISNCQRNEPLYATNNFLKWELRIFNSNGSHLGEEERGLELITFLIIITTIALIISNLSGFFKFYSTEGNIDYPILIIIIALVVELLSIICEKIHLEIYSSDGQGSFFFNFANHALSVISQLFVICLILLIACGWSINFYKFKNIRTLIKLGVLLGAVHIIIVWFGRSSEDEYRYYHDYENRMGLLIMIIRLLLYVLWMYLFQKTYKSIKEDEKIFFNCFGILSSLYFLAIPAMLLYVTERVVRHFRHKAATISILLLQITSLIILTWIFNIKENKYHQISMKSRSILVTNKSE